MHNLFSRECHFFLSVFIYSFLAVVGLRCCVGFFSSYDKWGLLWSCSARVLIVVASRVAETELEYGGFSSCGKRALEHRLSSCGARA